MTRRVLPIALAFLAGYFVFCNVFPFAFLVLLFWTAGLFAYLYVLNTVFLYLVAATPALLCIDRKPHGRRLAAGAAVLVPIVAVVPPMMSERLSLTHAERLLADDIEAGVAEMPKSVELVGEARRYLGRRTPLNDAACEALCQRLLLSRQVNLVRVKPDHAARAVNGMDYVLETRPRLCPDAFEEGVALLPETKDAVLTGTCFVARDAGPEPIAARIEIRKTSFPAPQNLLADVWHAGDVVKGLQVLKISVAQSGGWSLKLQKTQVTFSHWNTPLFVGQAECSDRANCSDRPAFARVDRTINAFDPDELALRTLGIKPLEPVNRLSPGARVMAMLDRTGSFFAAQEKQLVADWVKSMACKSEPCGPVTGVDGEVLQRLRRDPRTWYFIGQEMSWNPGFVTANLDGVLDQMTASGANGLFSNLLGPTVARLDIEKLRARRDRLMPLIRDNDWKVPGGIGILSGRLGVDTSDLISERLAQFASAETAAMAACMADVDVGKHLVPALLKYLSADNGENYRAYNASRDVIKALARFGHFEDVKELARVRFPKLVERYSQRKDEADIANDVSLCNPD